jgi:hypothetical protein
MINLVVGLVKPVSVGLLGDGSSSLTIEAAPGQDIAVNLNRASVRMAPAR